MGMFIYTFKPNKKEYHKISQKTVCIDTLLTRKLYYKDNRVFFSRRSWKTFQSLAWGESTWRLKHVFFKNWLSDPKTYRHFCMYNDQGNSVHYDCRRTSRALRMLRITVDLGVDSAEHTDTRATWADIKFYNWRNWIEEFYWSRQSKSWRHIN